MVYRGSFRVWNRTRLSGLHPDCTWLTSVQNAVPLVAPYGLAYMVGYCPGIVVIARSTLAVQRGGPACPFLVVMTMTPFAASAP